MLGSVFAAASFVLYITDWQLLLFFLFFAHGTHGCRIVKLTSQFGLSVSRNVSSYAVSVSSQWPGWQISFASFKDCDVYWKTMTSCWAGHVRAIFLPISFLKKKSLHDVIASMHHGSTCFLLVDQNPLWLDTRVMEQSVPKVPGSCASFLRSDINIKYRFT